MWNVIQVACEIIPDFLVEMHDYTSSPPPKKIWPLVGESPLSKLIPELLQKIVFYLEREDQVSFALVQRSWTEPARNGYLQSEIFRLNCLRETFLKDHLHYDLSLRIEQPGVLSSFSDIHKRIKEIEKNLVYTFANQIIPYYQNEFTENFRNTNPDYPEVNNHEFAKSVGVTSTIKYLADKKLLTSVSPLLDLSPNFMDQIASEIIKCKKISSRIKTDALLYEIESINKNFPFNLNTFNLSFLQGDLYELTEILLEKGEVDKIFEIQKALNKNKLISHWDLINTAVMMNKGDIKTKNALASPIKTIEGIIQALKGLEEKISQCKLGKLQIYFHKCRYSITILYGNKNSLNNHDLNEKFRYEGKLSSIEDKPIMDQYTGKNSFIEICGDIPLSLHFEISNEIKNLMHRL